jgi:hypothetical protein
MGTVFNYSLIASAETFLGFALGEVRCCFNKGDRVLLQGARLP